jgi:hypothetical protein
MLHEFVTSNRTELVARCRNKVGKRLSPSEIPLALDHGVPLFLQAYGAIKSGQVRATGATGTLLVKTLEDLRSLTDRTLPEIRRGYEVAIP